MGYVATLPTINKVLNDIWHESLSAELEITLEKRLSR